MCVCLCHNTIPFRGRRLHTKTRSYESFWLLFVSHDTAQSHLIHTHTLFAWGEYMLCNNENSRAFYQPNWNWYQSHRTSIECERVWSAHELCMLCTYRTHDIFAKSYAKSIIASAQFTSVNMSKVLGLSLSSTVDDLQVFCSLRCFLYRESNNSETKHILMLLNANDESEESFWFSAVSSLFR